jgi:serine/threonine-protein kinase
MKELEGKTLKGQYFLKQLIGKGGMASVYRAWDNRRRVEMAVKVLRRDLAMNARFIQLFTQEAEHLRTLEHPNIVRFYEFNRDAEVVFIVMEWIDGENLRQRIHRLKRPLNIDEVKLILKQICPALDYAHQYQVYHCDVKPANFLVNQHGDAKLTDFGVARHAADSFAGGTLEYMAPELLMAAPQNARIDARTDVYGLGVTLYEMLSGGYLPYPPPKVGSSGYREETRERLKRQIQTQNPPSLRLFNNSITPAIENVVLTAMHKEPSQRYPTTIHLYEAFVNATLVKPMRGRGETVVIPPPSPQSTPQKPPAVSQPVQPTSSQQVSKPPTLPLSLPNIKGPYLYGNIGEWKGRVIEVDGEITIGRSSENQIVLLEPSVSRRHATIFRRRIFGGVFIRDENSSLGVYVNGERIPVLANIRLKDGDIIRLGYNQVFEFREK